MKIPHKLIGFDVRRPGDRPIGPERPTTAEPFRPRGPGVSPCLSFDPYVNPSVFGGIDESESTHDREPEYMKYYRADRIMIPNGVNTGFDFFWLWDDAKDMMVHYPDDESAADAAYAYAWIDLTAQGIQPPSDECFGLLTTWPTCPASLSEDWPLVGYDIVSWFYNSILSGYDLSQSSPEFIEYVRPHINPFGLISAQATPEELAGLVRAADNEITADSFLVVGLYLLWDNSGRVAQGLGLVDTQP